MGAATRERPGVGVGLLLAGIAINSVCSALILLVHGLAGMSQSFAISRWLIGSLDAIEGSRCSPMQAPSSCSPSWSSGRRANGTCSPWARLGRHARRQRPARAGPGYLAGSMLAAATVALTGPIGFVGLVVPHILRARLGADDRVLMPCAFLLGGVLLASCDALGRVADRAGRDPGGRDHRLHRRAIPDLDRPSRSRPMSGQTPSPVVEAYDALRSLNASWSVEVGTPTDPGWIAGADLRTAASGPFNALLVRIGERAGTGDRRTIAASFALRFGWASAMAIAPYLRHRCVPDIALDNVSFKFKPSTFFERTAIHEPRGVVVAGDPRAAHPSIGTVPDADALNAALRRELVAQATPVVDALFEWSGFARARHVGPAHVVLGVAVHRAVRRSARSPFGTRAARVAVRRRRRRRADAAAPA